MFDLSLLLSCFKLVLGWTDYISFIPAPVTKLLQFKYPKWGVANDIYVCRHFIIFSLKYSKLALKIIPPIEWPTIIILNFLEEFSNWLKYASIYPAAFLPISYNERSILWEYDFKTKNLLLLNIFFKFIFSFYILLPFAWYPWAKIKIFLCSG